MIEAGDGEAGAADATASLGDPPGIVGSAMAGVSSQAELDSIVRRAWHSLAALTRLEDWLLAFVVVFAAPLVVHRRPAGGGSDGLFGPGDPVQGLLRLTAVLAVLICAAARSADQRPGASRSIFGSAAVGPFSGAVLLVAASGATALSLPGPVVEGYAAVALALMVLARLGLPALPPFVRRALVAPFILVAASLFWSAIDAVLSGPLVTGGGAGLTVSALQSLVTSQAFLFVAAFSGVYYAMLVYAPRQVADPGGSPLAWAIRFLLFLAGIVLGIGWLTALGG